MKRTILVFGSLAGLVVTCFMAISLMLHKCSMDLGSMIIGYTGMVASFLFIFVGVKNFRDKHNNGSITFGKAFMLGLYITLIASTIYVIVWLIEYYCFIPDFMDRYSETAIMEAKASGATGAVLEGQIKDIESMKEMYKNPLFVILFTYAEILPVGLLMTLISALVMKRKPKLDSAAQI